MGAYRGRGLNPIGLGKVIRLSLLKKRKEKQNPMFMGRINTKLILQDGGKPMFMAMAAIIMAASAALCSCNKRTIQTKTTIEKTVKIETLKNVK